MPIKFPTTTTTPTITNTKAAVETTIKKATTTKTTTRAANTSDNKISILGNCVCFTIDIYFNLHHFVYCALLFSVPCTSFACLPARSRARSFGEKVKIYTHLCEWVRASTRVHTITITNTSPVHYGVEHTICIIMICLRAFSWEFWARIRVLRFALLLSDLIHSWFRVTISQSKTKQKLKYMYDIGSTYVCVCDSVCFHFISIVLLKLVLSRKKDEKKEKCAHCLFGLFPLFLLIFLLFHFGVFLLLTLSLYVAPLVCAVLLFSRLFIYLFNFFSYMAVNCYINFWWDKYILY